MDIIKKLSAILLALSMIVGSSFVKNNAYASPAYKKELRLGQTYYYDIDGDGDKDRISHYVSNGNLILKVNNTTKVLLEKYNMFDGRYTLRIYDFYKKDKSVEIVLEWTEYSNWGLKIYKFKNNTCKVSKNYPDALLRNYNSNTGEVTMESYDCGNFSSFAKAIGAFGCYEKAKIKGYNVSNDKNVKTTDMVKQNKYKAAKSLTAYTSTNSKKKAFTAKKGSILRVYELCKVGNSRYIKVKNTSGKYGYIKVGNSRIFTKDSIIYAR